MSSEREVVSLFFDEWTKEFARALEMFTGEKPGVACAPLSPGDMAAEEVAGLTWWKQVFQGAGSFTVWLGAPEQAWRELGSVMAANADQAREAFLEMLGQAQQGTAAVISAGLTNAVQCQNLEDCEPPSLETQAVRRVSIEFRGAALAPLLLALDPAAAQVIGDEASGEMVAPERTETTAGELELAGSSQMLRRLMDIDLPLSVSLGRAVLPVRDVLKMTPGALIELDRDIGESVDVLVHGTVVARGEVVSVKGNYGVRIKEIISREDRLALRKRA